MTQRFIVFCPAKTEGFMIWLPVIDAKRDRFFCLGMTSLPADDAREALFLLHRTAASESTSEISLGIRPRALPRAPSVSLGTRKHRGEALSSTSFPHQKSRRSCFARAPTRSQFCDSFLRKLCLALVSRLGSSKLLLRKPCFEAYRKIAPKLLMRHFAVVLGLTLYM